MAGRRRTQSKTMSICSAHSRSATVTRSFSESAGGTRLVMRFSSTYGDR